MTSLKLDHCEVMESPKSCEREFEVAQVEIKQEQNDENLPDTIPLEQNDISTLIKPENYWEDELVLDWNENDNVTDEPQTVKMPQRKRRQRKKRFKIYCASCNKADGWKDQDSICADCDVPLTFQCNACYVKFPSSGRIWHHVRKFHPKVYNYLCPECDFVSENENLVLKHVKKTHLTLKSYKIKKLDTDRINEKKKLDQKKNLSGAQSSRFPVFERLKRLSVYFCVKCSKESDIYRPREKKFCHDCQSQLVFKCLKCSKHRPTEKGILYHLLSVCDPQERFQCSKCNYSSYIKKYVARHYKSMHDSETYVCEKCNRICKNSQNFTLHKKRYCGLKFSFHCDHCPFYSENKKVLRRHILKEHIKQNRFACHKCNATYKYRHSLDHHLTHCGKKPQFKCEQCRFKTRYKCELVRHIRRIHSVNGKKKKLDISRVRCVVETFAGSSRQGV